MPVGIKKNRTGQGVAEKATLAEEINGQVALIIIDKKCKQPKCLSTDKRYVRRLGCHPAGKSGTH